MDNADWLSSNQIDTFIEKLSYYLKKHARNRLVITDTTFYLFLKQHVFAKSSIEQHRDWWLRVFSRNQNVFQHNIDLLDQILIPINLTSSDNPTGTHWVLAVVAPRKRRIFIGDSCTNSASVAHRDAADVLLQFIDIYSQVFGLAHLSATETRVERIDPDAFLVRGSMPMWELCMIKIKDLQRDDINCGVYMLALLCLCSLDPQDKIPKNIRLLRPVEELRELVETFMPSREFYVKHGSRAQEMALASVADISRNFWVQLLEHLSFSYAYIP